MGIHDTFRFGSHAMVFNAENKVLLLKRTYGNKGWSLPGGAVDPGETIHQALFRECREELGINVIDPVLTGLYYHRSINTHAAIFRCMISDDDEIVLSSEHSALRWADLTELSESQRVRAEDAMRFKGQVYSRAF
ncbi:NUDIX domain-containing protein [Fictibacillus sp. 5RED26]|uniref:NUDIX hydrolase n=1 Tax=unclassified Fictibacillus TaxID=2644029 RepID=UPI0018CEAF7C|nr:MULTISPECIES: NUDIX domain-containing protein [unclassified Fictibacillus]MBH0156319.1 NUDIX domain-containing protein [Fictibacillus sp. 5RED26]MBH0166905.1 NUDIX domain-containing protein [Fictibacillus sp. 7GRE50]